MALYKYFKPISKLCKKCDKLELPYPKDSFALKFQVMSSSKLTAQPKSMFMLLAMVLHREALT